MGLTVISVVGSVGLGCSSDTSGSGGNASETSVPEKLIAIEEAAEDAFDKALVGSFSALPPVADDADGLELVDAIEGVFEK